MATSLDKLSLALFESSSLGGVRLIGRTRDAGLVEQVRNLIADEHRRDLADLEPSESPPLRLVAEEEPPSGD